MKMRSFIMLAHFVVLTLVSLQSLKSEKHEDINKQDSLELDRKKYITLVKESIETKKQLPADSVFKNIKTLKGVPAGQLLGIMYYAYSKSLGVSCGHCHNTNQWDSDEKKPKLIAREMSRMSNQINVQLLKEISLIKDAAINCTTCHRGQVKPALDLD